MSSCFGFCNSSDDDGEREPLLPVYEDDTSLQRAVHAKLHTYQMLRALSKGFMPSTEQTIVNLRTLLSSDVLNPATPGLSESGRKLAKYSKQLLQEFIDLLRNKNNEDKLQDFIWLLLNTRVDINAEDLIRTVGDTKAKADATAGMLPPCSLQLVKQTSYTSLAYESIKTVGGLLLTNSDFRIFLSDLNTIARQVFADTANTLSTVASDVAGQVEPSSQDLEVLREPGKDPEPISKEDLKEEAAEISHVITEGLEETGREAEASLKENVSGKQKEVLINRLKAAVSKLRRRNDYSDSVSTIGLLIQRYAKTYSRAVDNTVSAAQDDITANDELDKAMRTGWSLISSFGDRDAWNELERRLSKVVEHSKKDPEFESTMVEVSVSLQKMLTDPEFFDSASIGVDELKEKSKEMSSGSPLRQDVDALLRQIHVVFNSVINDDDVQRLLSTGFKIWDIVSPVNTSTNQDLFTDATTVLIPLLIEAIQYIPIPRLEVISPEIDLLLENLILEPGRTINSSSFLPFRLNLETYNGLTIRKARLRTHSAAKSLVSITLHGLSVRADDVGFLLRAHKSLLRFSDEGLASFHLDERGIDIALEVEISRTQPENILVLRDVQATIHHLDYTLRKSKFSFLAWIFKPLLRPLIRNVLERQLATAVRDFLHAANREVVFARERLRATRIADPKDMATFFRAVAARFRVEDHPDTSIEVGVQGSVNARKGVFAGEYAPGSVVKLWNEEAVRAGETVDDHAQRSWRNEIFDVQSSSM
jgi:hypothetical protein